MLYSILLSAFAAAVAADTIRLNTMAFDIGEDARNPDSPNPLYLPVVLANNGTEGHVQRRLNTHDYSLSHVCQAGVKAP